MSKSARTIKKVHPFVVKALDEFGKKKWGTKGFLTKRKLYSIYCDKEMNLPYSWKVVSVYRDIAGAQYVTDFKTGQGQNQTLYKYPGYRITLSLDSNFLVGYGGYAGYYYDGNAIQGYDLVHYLYSEDLSESVLKKALSEVLANSYEPMAIALFELESSKQVRA